VSPPARLFPLSLCLLFSLSFLLFICPFLVLVADPLVPFPASAHRLSSLLSDRRHPGRSRGGERLRSGPRGVEPARPDTSSYDGPLRSPGLVRILVFSLSSIFSPGSLVLSRYSMYLSVPLARLVSPIQASLLRLPLGFFSRPLQTYIMSSRSFLSGPKLS
jgi:hypothetical protein